MLSFRGSRSSALLVGMLWLTQLAWAQSIEKPLSADDLARLARGEIVVADVEGLKSGGAARAAIQINATAERVFQTLIDCKQALHFVPDMERCKVLDTAPDGSWSIVEQTMGSAWYVPRAHFVFRAEYKPYKQIRFTQVKGYFRRNDGLWTFQPAPDGVSTIVTYAVHIVPRMYAPGWAIRASLRRGLPELMQGLRERCEAPDASRPSDSHP